MRRASALVSLGVAARPSHVLLIYWDSKKKNTVIVKNNSPKPPVGQLSVDS